MAHKRHASRVAILFVSYVSVKEIFYTKEGNILINMTP